MRLDAVNSKFFATVLFSRNFADTKFMKNKSLANWHDHSHLLIFETLSNYQTLLARLHALTVVLHCTEIVQLFAGNRFT